jgi:L-ascorbate metabolism protein UlaG (beta-lactamase superfamily)
MRLKPGRPDIDVYRDRFDLSEAVDAPVSVTFLGVSTLLIRSGASAWMTDGFFSRPSLPRVLMGRLSPDRDRIDSVLRRAEATTLAGVVPVHTHYDHGMDSAAVAELTGAGLYGGVSAARIGEGHGMTSDKIHVVTSGDTCSLGDFEVTFVASEHCPPDRWPGEIPAPVVPPARVSAYRCGEAWSLLVHHRPSGRRLLVQGSAGFVPGALAGHQAEVAYLGVGQLGVMPEDYIRRYWDETVRTAGARRVVLIHWDDFFRPLDRPLRALPYLGDDLDVTMRVFDELAADEGVPVSFPQVWRGEDPWSGIAETG